jgi:hypothetical protein
MGVERKPSGVTKEAEEAIRTIQEVAMTAVHNLSSIAETMKAAGAKNNEDHDILITLVEVVRGVREDIKELKDGTSSRISCLEQNKADKLTVSNLEDGIERDVVPKVNDVVSKMGSITIRTNLFIAFVIGLAGIVIWDIVKHSL